MYKIIGQNINMTEGDFGVVLPITIILEGSEHLTASDSFKISIYTKTNGQEILSKEYSADNHNTINFELTEQESGLFKVGTYFSLNKSISFLFNIL